MLLAPASQNCSLNKIILSQILTGQNILLFCMPAVSIYMLGYLMPDRRATVAVFPTQDLPVICSL